MITSTSTITIIKAVQTHLGLASDGIAGLRTWSAILSALHQVHDPADLHGNICMAQKILQIPADGIDGPATWAAITRALDCPVDGKAVAAADVAAQDIGAAAKWDALFIGHASAEQMAAPVKIVAVRAYLEGTSREDRTDIYSAAMVVINQGNVRIFRAAVDPSTYLIRHPINADGAAELTAGLWTFRRGLHHGNPKLPCFIQAQDFIVNRLNRDGSFSHKDTGDFGIHIHSGGSEETTDRFTAGCQVIWNPDGYRAPDGGWGDFYYREFYYPMIATMQAVDQATLPYLLINAEDV